jgi:hypothetical protein
MCDEERNFMSAIQYASTKDLVSELFNRTTFAGMLVYSLVENKFEGQIHEFAIKTTVDAQSSIHMLTAALEIMKLQEKER